MTLGAEELLQDQPTITTAEEESFFNIAPGPEIYLDPGVEDSSADVLQPFVVIARRKPDPGSKTQERQDPEPGAKTAAPAQIPQHEQAGPTKNADGANTSRQNPHGARPNTYLLVKKAGAEVPRQKHVKGPMQIDSPGCMMNVLRHVAPKHLRPATRFGALTQDKHQKHPQEIFHSVTYWQRCQQKGLRVIIMAWLGW